MYSSLPLLGTKSHVYLFFSRAEAVQDVSAKQKVVALLFFNVKGLSRKCHKIMLQKYNGEPSAATFHQQWSLRFMRPEKETDAGGRGKDKRRWLSDRRPRMGCGGRSPSACLNSFTLSN